MNILLVFPGFIIALIIVLYYELKIRNISVKPKNKVHFYVARDRDKTLWLYLGKPFRSEDGRSFVSNKHGSVVTHGSCFENLGLNLNNYKDLKWEDEPVEVFLNMEK